MWSNLEELLHPEKRQVSQKGVQVVRFLNQFLNPFRLSIILHTRRCLEADFILLKILTSKLLVNNAILNW